MSVGVIVGEIVGDASPRRRPHVQARIKQRANEYCCQWLFLLAFLAAGDAGTRRPLCVCSNIVNLFPVPIFYVSRRNYPNIAMFFP